jgi:hypothetical protein
MKRFSMTTAAAALVLAASAFLAQPVTAAPPEELLSCTESQKSEIRNWIADTCDGSGWASAYCSWTGLWEIRSYGCTDTALR